MGVGVGVEVEVVVGVEVGVLVGVVDGVEVGNTMSDLREKIDGDSPPERIWLQPDSPDFKRDTTWCWHPLDVEGEVQYVRYDFVADLKAENKKLREKISACGCTHTYVQPI